MSTKRVVASIGQVLCVGALVIAGLLMVGGMLWMCAAMFPVLVNGTARVSSMLLPWFAILTVLVVGLDVFVLLPLAIPRGTRRFSSIAMFVSSYVFGITLWMEGLLLTLHIWGLGAVFIGVFLAGVGVVPIAMLATGLNSMWIPLAELVLLAVATFASQAGALSLAESLDASETEVSAEPCTLPEAGDIQ